MTLRAAIAGTAGSVLDHVANIRREVAAVRFTGERARICTATALSVTLAVTLAQFLSFDDVWWAGISGLMASQATRPASIERSILRIAGTVAGAALGCVAMSLFAYDQVALLLVLFVCGTIGVLGMTVSPHGYAWLFGGLTTNMIIMMAMNDPGQTPFIAFDRLAEVSLGCLAAVLVALALAPDDGATPAAAAPTGWTDLLGASWPAVRHAIRSGITVMLMPVIWNLFNLPSLIQMAITVTAVMAVPVPLSDPSAVHRLEMQRSVLRIIGCLFGGVLGLLCLALPLTVYALWLAVVFAGVWICAHVQASKDAISYAGIQAAVVYIVMMVQGSGPPSSILPGIDRFAGILCGLGVLLLVGLVLRPAPRPAQPV
jgi:uncharacterized membrane protein YccC